MAFLSSSLISFSCSLDVFHTIRLDFVFSLRYASQCFRTSDCVNLDENRDNFCVTSYLILLFSSSTVSIPHKHQSRSLWECVKNIKVEQVNKSAGRVPINICLTWRCGLGAREGVRTPSTLYRSWSTNYHKEHPRPPWWIEAYKAWNRSHSKSFWTGYQDKRESQA